LIRGPYHCRWCRPRRPSRRCRSGRSTSGERRAIDFGVNLVIRDRSPSDARRPPSRRELVFTRIVTADLTAGLSVVAVTVAGMATPPPPGPHDVAAISPPTSPALVSIAAGAVDVDQGDVVLQLTMPAPLPLLRADPLGRLPGSPDADPFDRLAAGWLVGHPANTAKAYRLDLMAWADWCRQRGVHPLAAERHHVDAWVRDLSSRPGPRTGRPVSAATLARRLSALAGFFAYGIDAQVLVHSPVAAVRRPKVSDESQASGLNADQLRRLLQAATGHSPRSAALVALLVFCGPRISEALGADLRDYGHDAGHRILKVIRKGGKTDRLALPPVVVRALDTHLAHRAGGPDGPLFLAADESTRYPYTSAYEQLLRLCRTAGLPAGITPHSLRHSYATEALKLAALQDVQDAMGHADPRTTRRYDRARRQLDRSPNYLLAATLTDHTD
jgi:integrase/recombinase XerD